jgi:hypothetical protein
MKLRLVENINITFSRERTRRNTIKEDGLIPIYRDYNALTIKVKERPMNQHLVRRIKRRRNDSTVERLEIWRNYNTIINITYITR